MGTLEASRLASLLGVSCERKKEEAKMPVVLWPERPKEWGYPLPFPEVRTWGEQGPASQGSVLNC